MLQLLRLYLNRDKEFQLATALRRYFKHIYQSDARVGLENWSAMVGSGRFMVNTTFVRSSLVLQI